MSFLSKFVFFFFYFCLFSSIFRDVQFDCKAVGGWKHKFSLLCTGQEAKRSVKLDLSTHNASRFHSTKSRKWKGLNENECQVPKFPLPTPLCTGYGVKKKDRQRHCVKTRRNSTPLLVLLKRENNNNYLLRVEIESIIIEFIYCHNSISKGTIQSMKFRFILQKSNVDTHDMYGFL